MMVPDTPDVETVLFGENGVAAGLTKGKTVVDMSSISPIATKDFAKKINALGCDYLDAPVSGGEVGAKAASLTIMVGGPQAAFERVKPLFELMGKNITLVGGNGDGQTTQGRQPDHRRAEHRGGRRSAVFAARPAPTRRKVRQALMGGFASSRILEVHGERMIKRTFDPGFRIELHQKDLNLALPARARSAWRCRNTATPRSCSGLRRATAAASLGSLGAGAGARDDGQPRDRQPDRPA